MSANAETERKLRSSPCHGERDAGIDETSPAPKAVERVAEIPCKSRRRRGEHAMKTKAVYGCGREGQRGQVGSGREGEESGLAALHPPLHTH
eukprot:3351942-Prymnesium_polylepis.1